MANEVCSHCGAHLEKNFFHNFKMVMLNRISFEGKEQLKQELEQLLNDPNIPFSKKLAVFTQRKILYLLISKVFDLKENQISGPNIPGKTWEFNVIRMLVAFPNGDIVEYLNRLPGVKHFSWSDLIEIFFDNISNNLSDQKIPQSLIDELKQVSLTPEKYDQFKQEENISFAKLLKIFQKVRICICPSLDLLIFELGEDFDPSRYHPSNYFDIFNYD